MKLDATAGARGLPFSETFIHSYVHNEDLDDALGGGADIVLIEACNMQEMEVAYQCRNCCEYFVASQAAKTYTQMLTVKDSDYHDVVGDVLRHRLSFVGYAGGSRGGRQGLLARVCREQRLGCYALAWNEEPYYVR